MPAADHLSHSVIETTAGFVAGLTSTLIVHPLDIVKTRLQVDSTSPSKFGNSARVVKELLQSNQTTFAALYRGLSPNLIGNSLSWAFYFVWYDKTKKQIQAYHGDQSDLSYHEFFLASGIAGGFTAICTNPIWVIKTRMLSTSSKHPRAYSSVADGARDIFRSEGLRGFYRGLLPSLFGVSHGALQFMVYEKLKISRRRRRQGDLSSSDFLFLSGFAKIFAGSVTYPYQVVRARLQMYDSGKIYRGAKDVMVKVWREEGIKGFYKGLAPNLLRVLPSTWVTFLVYEKCKLFLQDMQDWNDEDR